MISRRSIFGFGALGGLVASGLLAWPGRARAHEVKPLIFDLTPTGPRAAATMEVANTEAAPIAVEIYAERRTISEDGVETRERADDDFIFSPPQMQVPAGENRPIRLRYIGDPGVDRSVSYVVTVAQLPLQVMQQTGVQVLINFAASVHVAPPGLRSDLKALGGALGADADGKPVARFTIVNEGRLHQGMSAGAITLRGPEGRVHRVEGEAMSVALAHTLIQALSRRNVTAPLPEGWPTEGDVSVELTVPVVTR